MGPSSNSHREKITVVSRMEKENALPCAAANGKKPVAKRGKNEEHCSRTVLLFSGC